MVFFVLLLLVPMLKWSRKPSKPFLRAVECAQVNVHMAGLVPSTPSIYQPADDVAPSQEATWMSALGIMYIDHVGEQQKVTIELDQSVARDGGELPFNLTFNWDPTIDLNLAQVSRRVWSSGAGARTARTVSKSVTREGGLNLATD